MASRKLIEFILYLIVLTKCNTMCKKTNVICDETKTWMATKDEKNLNDKVKQFAKEDNLLRFSGTNGVGSPVEPWVSLIFNAV